MDRMRLSGLSGRVSGRRSQTGSPGGLASGLANEGSPASYLQEAGADSLRQGMCLCPHVLQNGTPIAPL